MPILLNSLIRLVLSFFELSLFARFAHNLCFPLDLSFFHLVFFLFLDIYDALMETTRCSQSKSRTTCKISKQT